MQVGRQRQVAEQLGHPVVAAAADETDARLSHVLRPFVRALPQVRCRPQPCDRRPRTGGSAPGVAGLRSRMPVSLQLPAARKYCVTSSRVAPIVEGLPDRRRPWSESSDWRTSPPVARPASARDPPRAGPRRAASDTGSRRTSPAASNASASKGSARHVFRSCTTWLSGVGWRQAPSSFRPSPTTRAYWTSSGRWLTQLLIRSSTRPTGGKQLAVQLRDRGDGAVVDVLDEARLAVEPRVGRLVVATEAVGGQIEGHAAVRSRVPGARAYTRSAMPLSIPLAPVDSLTVTTLVDNVFDVFMPDQGPAHRLTSAAKRRPCPRQPWSADWCPTSSSPSTACRYC